MDKGNGGEMVALIAGVSLVLATLITASFAYLSTKLGKVKSNVGEINGEGTLIHMVSTALHTLGMLRRQMDEVQKEQENQHVRIQEVDSKLDTHLREGKD